MAAEIKGQIILTIGLPGSGKSTYLQRKGIQPLSTDTLRLWLLDDETDQSQQARIFGVLRLLLRIRLQIGRPRNYIDATNLTRRERRPYKLLAKEFGYELCAVFFDVPLEVCMQRNRKRKRIVPDDVMEMMARKLQPPTPEEGFAKISVVRK
jgi:predicted kinase